MIGIDTTCLSVVFALVGLFYPAALLLVPRRRPPAATTGDDRHRFTLLVPLRNEASVVHRTVAALRALDYPPDRMEIVLIDDGSTDGTGTIARGLAREDPARVRVVTIPRSRSGRGKSEALNAGLRFSRARSRFAGRSDWVIGVFDADGRPDPDMLRAASARFADPRVGAAQATVRIANRDRNLLARMQDLEFAAFARVTQYVRSIWTGTAALGGNGQFIRASALEEVRLDDRDRSWWRPGYLTEDLELSVRLNLAGWDTRFLDGTAVHQEGVEAWGHLFRQRRRWAWGTLQVFRAYVLTGAILRAPALSAARRADLLVSLSLFLVSPLILVTWALTAFTLLGIVGVTNALPGALTLLFSFSFVPIVAHGMWTLREYRDRWMPLRIAAFILYTYHWLPCIYAAAMNVLGRDRPQWAKTPRVARRTERGESAPTVVGGRWAPALSRGGVVWLAALLLFAGYLRAVTAALPESFEDGYQHWWIAAYRSTTGSLGDPFSGMTRGNWLPIYDLLAAGIMPLTGVHNMEWLKAINIACSLATVLVVFALGRRVGPAAGWAAAGFLAFNPTAIYESAVALPEALAGLATFGGYALLTGARPGDRGRLAAAAIALVVAVGTRYEAWLFLLLVVAFRCTRKERVLANGDVLLVVTPAALFILFWIGAVSSDGFLPATIVGQTSTDIRYKDSTGILEPVTARLGAFFYLYAITMLVPLVLGFAYAMATIRRSLLAQTVLVFFGALALWTVLGFGNPSPRYAYLGIIALTLCAGTAAQRIALALASYQTGARRVAGTTARSPRPGGATAAAVVLLLLVPSAADGYNWAYPADDPGELLRGMVRAGDFLAQQELPPGRVVVCESPITAYRSGFPPDRIVGSAGLPEGANATHAWLVEHAAFVVVVTVPWYHLRSQLPALANGTPVEGLTLIYDASGPEYDLGAHRVLVYRVDVTGGGPGGG